MNTIKTFFSSLNFKYLDHILLVVTTIVIAFLISLILRKIAQAIITKYSERIKVDPTNYSFLKNSLSFIIFSIAVIFIFIKIPFFNSLGNALFAGAGVTAAAIGFASQKAISNIVSGIFILIFKPFRVGDTINFSTYKGVVEEITLRHTVIQDYENRRIVIPNSTISEDTIINSDITDEKIRKHLEFGISYDSNIDKAIEIIQKEAEKHPLLIDYRTSNEINNGEPIVLVRVVEHGEYAIKLKAYLWCEGNDNAFALSCDLLKSIKEEFDKNGIEIPFPYRTIVYKNDIPKHS
ncbi:mechanosensitive ion channel family protein [Vicingus serpentipes]|uniref:Mechanosensitive ion channel family protein n=1 Tax=Vicingus serpentipes TaxID=1926625 RepID=A0A5C6RRE8_9FLAO|nr:mechanosensitive ion channel family protein [Vicingus serpentipes]TXB64569.1 mechanosensitive ion channel family protein [Vicingus serpentipes]